MLLGLVHAKIAVLLVTSLTYVNGAIASVQPITFNPLDFRV